MPLYLANDCRLMSNSTWHSLWSADISTCMVPRTLNSYSDRTFAAAGPRLWNSLPVQLRDPDITYGLFRRQLKGHLFRKHEHGSLWLLICGAIEKHLLINLTDITAVVTRDYTVLPAICTFIHNWSELHLPLSASHKSSQPFGRYAFSIPLRVGDSVGRGGLVTEVVCLRRSPIPLITGNKVD